MSACSGFDQDDRSEDGDLGLGHGCQPGSLPPFEILRRPRPSSTPHRLPEPSTLRDSDETESVTRPRNALMKLTTKLGFYSRPKCVSPADDNVHDQSECDAVVLGTSLKQQKLVFHRDMINIQRRRSVDLQQFGGLGILCFCIFLFAINTDTTYFF